MNSAVFLKLTYSFEVIHTLLAKSILTQVVNHAPIAFCNYALTVNRFAFSYLNHAMIAAIS